MIKPILSFLTKAVPRFVGEIIKNPKNTIKIFKEAGEKLEQSEFGKKAEAFLGQKPGEYLKECARSAVQQSTINAMMGLINGGISKVFSGGGGKQYSFPPKSSGNVTGGVGKAPGIQTTNAAQHSSVRTFNQASRALGMDYKKQNLLRKKQKKTIDNYRREYKRKNFSIAEITTLSTQLENKLQQQKNKLTSGLKSGKHAPENLEAVKPAKKLKQPHSIPQEQQQLATYTKEAIEDMNAQLQDNIKAVNTNISKSIAEMNKKEEEIAQKMMANLGNYNTIAYKNLADTVTKTETVAFQKQEASSYHQTDMLAEKLDSSHDYNSKQMEVVRGEVLENTQTMYELDKQNRMIAENYRALEERKNNGFTLATIGALLTQTYQMVHSSLKTPDVINDNVNNAMRSVAFTAGEEVGKMIQMLAELLQAIRAPFQQLYRKVHGMAIVGPVVGGLVNALDWVNDRIFRGLLGVEDSVVGDLFGRPGNVADIQVDAIKEKYGDEEGSVTVQEVTQPKKMYANEEGYVRGAAMTSDASVNSYMRSDLVNSHFADRDGKVEMLTNSGYAVTLKSDRKEDESFDDYKARKVREAIEIETEDFGYVAQSSSARDTKAEASARLKDAYLYIENTKLTRSSVSEWDVDYVISGEEKGESHPPALKYADRNTISANKQEITNNKDHIESSKFQQHWVGKDTLQLAGELKLRVMKLLKEASKQGIKYYITSMLRVPNLKRSYLSIHNMGLAIDIGVGLVREKGESMSSLLEKYSVVIQRQYKDIKGMYRSTALSWKDLTDMVKRPDEYLVPGTPDDIKDIFLQWYTFLGMCSKQGLTFGSTSYNLAYRAMGRPETPDPSNPVDLVHISLSSVR